MRGRIESVLDAAKVRGLRSGENPAVWHGNLALLLPAPKKGPKRHHPAMPFSEVPAFVQRLRSLPGLSAKALELTILTAARTSEVLQARWPEFDLAASVWTVSAERIKAGREHRVPLSPAALALLTKLRSDGGELFFSRANPRANRSRTCRWKCVSGECV